MMLLLAPVALRDLAGPLRRARRSGARRVGRRSSSPSVTVPARDRATEPVRGRRAELARAARSRSCSWCSWARGSASGPSWSTSFTQLQCAGQRTPEDHRMQRNPIPPARAACAVRRSARSRSRCSSPPPPPEAEKVTVGTVQREIKVGHGPGGRDRGARLAQHRVDRRAAPRGVDLRQDLERPRRDAELDRRQRSSSSAAARARPRALRISAP